MNDQHPQYAGWDAKTRIHGANCDLADMKGLALLSITDVVQLPSLGRIRRPIWVEALAAWRRGLQPVSRHLV